MRPSFSFSTSKLSCAVAAISAMRAKNRCGSAKFRLASSRTSPAVPASSTSRGIFHISRYLSLKSVTLPSSSVTRIASVVDSSVARMITSAWQALSCAVRGLRSSGESPARRAGGFEERWSLSAGRRTGALPFRPQIPLYLPLIISCASSVPSTRERIFANAFSRVVEVSSQNGEKPQSSVVPSCSTGMYRAASRMRSRISSGFSTRGSMGETTPMNIRCPGLRYRLMIFRTRARSCFPASAT